MKRKGLNSENKSLIATIVIQLGVFALVYFIVAWEAPDPPIPVFGVELALASNTSSQTSTSPNLAEEIANEQNIESGAVETQEEATQSKVEESIPSETAEPTDASEDATESTKKQSEPKPTEEVAEEAAEEQVEQEIVKDAAEDRQPKEQIKEDSEADAMEESTTSAVDSSATIEETVLDERALFPSSGNGTQADDESISVDVAGFKLSGRPEIEDTTDESGKITFEISVGDDGYAIPGKVLYSSVSPSTISIYREAIQQLYFEQTSVNVPPQTKGTITFIIKAK